MRDIYLKKVSSTKENLASPPPGLKVSEKPAQNQVGVGLVLEKSFDLVGELVSYLLAWSTKESNHKIVQPVQPSSVAKPVLIKNSQVSSSVTKKSEGMVNASLYRPYKEEPKTNIPKEPILKKGRQHFKKGVAKVDGAIKTPLGRVATIQTLAIIALFVFVLKEKPFLSINNNPLGARNVGQTVQDLSIRKYLPTAQDYVQPKPFEQPTSNPQTSLAVQAWVTPWNVSQLQSSNSYTQISAFWLTAQSDGISFLPKADWKSWQAFRAQSSKAGQVYFLTVTGDPNNISTMLSNPTTQTQHIKNLLQIVQAQGFDGVDIDYEGLDQGSAQLFNNFIRNLTTTFHAANKLVSVTVEARIANQVPMDWKTLSGLADEIRIMAYDYHSSLTSEPGPVSPIGWLKEIMDYAQTTIDPKKLVVGLGDYGYDWQAPTTSGQSWKGTAISFDQAMALANREKATVIRSTGIDDRGYDIGSVANFSYVDSQNRQHQVWFEDNASIEAKIALINQYKINGVIFWSVDIGQQLFLQTTGLN
jgi:hypothetical protein